MYRFPSHQFQIYDTSKETHSLFLQKLEVQEFNELMVNFENWIGITCDTWLLQLPRHLHWTGSSQLPLNICHFSSRHSDVVTTLSQRRGWRCHNVVARSKMRVVATSVSDFGTTSSCDIVKTLPQRRHNVKQLLCRPFYYRQIWFLSHHRKVRELQKY